MEESIAIETGNMSTTNQPAITTRLLRMLLGLLHLVWVLFFGCILITGLFFVNISLFILNFEITIMLWPGQIRVYDFYI
jgi:hypothetical protein